MSAYQITVDGKDFTLDTEKIKDLDLLKTGPNTYHYIQDGLAYSVQIVDQDLRNKAVTLSVNGNKFSINIKDDLDLMVQKMGLSAGAAKKLSTIPSPMPGLILDILVKEGDPIEKGSQLLVLEAMKMENILKAEGEGIVKSVQVNIGDAVEKGQILIDLV